MNIWKWEIRFPEYCLLSVFMHVHWPGVRVTFILDYVLNNRHLSDICLKWEHNTQRKEIGKLVHKTIVNAMGDLVIKDLLSQWPMTACQWWSEVSSCRKKHLITFVIWPVIGPWVMRARRQVRQNVSFFCNTIEQLYVKHSFHVCWITINRSHL